MKVPDAADDAAQPTHEASWCDGSVGSNNLGPVQMSQCTGEDLKTGSLNTSPAASVYVSSAHWVAILEDISELKEQAEFENNTLSTEANDDSLAMDENERPALLSGYRGSFSKEDLLAAVPPRPVVDRLVSEYFNDLDMMPHLSCPHTGTFLREYENFWKNPSDVSLIWLGLLYGMMCLSARFSSTSLPSDPEPEWHDTKASRPLYLDQMVQCLVLGDYTRGGPYVIETLLHYFTIEHIRRPDTEIGIWLLVGVILRLALRMGYHRDPSHFESITPFQGEMRRRVWATLYIIDVMSSIQVGVPRMLQEAQCDTRAPLNLFDADFDETYSELPQPRDDNELTPMFYVLVRYRMVKVMGVLADIINGTQHNPSEAARAEELLQTTYDSLPSILKTAPGSGSIVDSPRILLHRYILAVVFHQARILLHQRCMATVPDDKSTGTIRSLGILVDAAIKVLEHQHLLYAETRPGGRLWSIRWKMSSTMSHEFLMATTVLSKILFSTLGPNPIVEAGSDMYTSIRIVILHELLPDLQMFAMDPADALKLLHVQPVEQFDLPVVHEIDWFCVLELAVSGT
ncbi:hypothetical protein ACJZ2D_013591 [Fusarium nematophilum]